MGSQVTTTGTAAVALNQAVAKQTTNQGLQRVSEEESTKCLLGQSAEEGKDSRLRKSSVIREIYAAGFSLSLFLSVCNLYQGQVA